MKKNPFVTLSCYVLLLSFLASCNSISVVEFRVTSDVVAGQSTSFIYTMKHTGTTPFGEIATKFYLSYDRKISENDILLKTKVIPELLPDDHVTFNENLSIPFNVHTGNYYIIASNSSVIVDAIHVTGLSNNGIDLVPTNLNFTGSIIGGTTAKIYHSVYNAGTANSQPTDARYYLKDENGNMTLLGATFVPSIATDRAAEIVTTLSIPELEMEELQEVYDLVLVVDDSNTNFEFQENNNDLSQRLTIQKPLPDLLVSISSPPITAQSGGNMAITLTLENIGQKPSDANIPFEIILSENPSIEDDDEVLLYISLPAMAVDFAFTDVPLVVAIPETAASGSYYVFVVTNRERTMVEASYHAASFRVCVHETCFANENEHLGDTDRVAEDHDHHHYLETEMAEDQAIHIEKSELLSTQDLIEKVQHQIKIYPNPALQRTNLSMELVEQSDVKIDVLSMSGTLLKSFKGKYNAGYATQMLDLTWVPSGAYLVKVHINKEVFTEKVVVQ